MFSFPLAKAQRNAKFKTPYLNILASQNIVDTSLHSILKSSHLGVSVTWCLGDFILGVPAIAVGLYALSLLASFLPAPKFPFPNPKSPFPNPNSHYLAKDAAAIPNAMGVEN